MSVDALCSPCASLLEFFPTPDISGLILSPACCFVGWEREARLGPRSRAGRTCTRASEVSRKPCRTTASLRTHSSQVSGAQAFGWHTCSSEWKGERGQIYVLEGCALYLTQLPGYLGPRNTAPWRFGRPLGSSWCCLDVIMVHTWAPRALAQLARPPHPRARPPSRHHV